MPLLSHSSHRQRPLAIVACFCLSALLTACPTTAEDALHVDPGLSEVDAAPDMDATDEGGASGTDSEESHGGGTSLRIRFVPRRRGLGAPGAAGPSAVEAPLSVAAPTTISLPAGVWVPTVLIDETPWVMTSTALTGLVRTDSITPQTQAGEDAAAILAAVDEDVHVRLSEDRTTLSLARATEPETMPWDAPGSTARVGHLFDDALFRINTGEAPGDVVVALMDALRRHGAGPAQTSRGVLFLAPGEAGGARPEVRGSFTNWEAAPRAQLIEITEGLWGRYIPVEDGRHTYKIVYPNGSGGDWFTDISNRHIEWDGIDTGSTGSFNSVLDLRAEPGGARLVWMRQVTSQTLGNTREVYIHLPDGYNEHTRAYPVLYIHDGNESIARAQFHLVAEEWSREHPGREAILVFVALPSQDVRFAEYTVAAPEARGEEYVTFLVEELIPMVASRFRARTARAGRGLMGASLGGLISFWAAITHPDVFEYTAGMSSSFFWADDVAMRLVQERGCQDITYYLDSGSPADNADVTREMRDVLARHGCPHTHVEETGGTHDWSYWKGRFPNVLRTFADVHAAP